MMLYKILRLIAYLNWITPLEILVRRVTDGPSHAFVVPDDAGWSGGRIICMLKEQGGIRTHGHMVRGNRIVFCVPVDQAGFAQYLLDRSGISVANRVPTSRVAPPSPPGATAQGQDFLSELDCWADNVIRTLDKLL
jgi:hypothetical protein